VSRDPSEVSAAMSLDGRTVSLGDYQRAVSGQIDAGFRFGQVEDFIHACPIEDEHKAALWLWAWLQQPPEVLRTLAESHLLRLAQAERG
jgi:hypothetical protein